VTKRERWLVGSVDGSATDERELEVRGIAEQLTIRARQRDDICALGDRGLTSQRNAAPARVSLAQLLQKLAPRPTVTWLAAGLS
jgi:hypothetical protein